jgi:ElaB/YqjD/DUF883 family membrane-anchored ribosome-binding protein
VESSATAVGLAQTAQEYGEKIAEAAGQAKEYVTDKMGGISGRITELHNSEIGEIVEKAKDYARENPGQTILLSSAAGLLVGLLLGRSRRLAEEATPELKEEPMAKTASVPEFRPHRQLVLSEGSKALKQYVISAPTGFQRATARYGNQLRELQTIPDILFRRTEIN